MSEILNILKVYNFWGWRNLFSQVKSPLQKNQSPKKIFFFTFSDIKLILKVEGY